VGVAKRLSITSRSSVESRPETSSRISVSSKGAPFRELKATVNTFGFGANHNADLLKAIAEAGTGLYFYVENSEMIGDAFVECIGGLLSVVGQNLKLEVAPTEGVSITDILTQYPHIRVGQGFEVRVKDLQSEECRDFMCQVDLPRVPQPCDQPLLTIRLTYDNLIRKGKDEVTEIASVQRLASDAEELKHLEVNLALDQQRNRIIAANALAKATELGNRGQMEEARAQVNIGIAKIKASPSARVEYCLELVKNLVISLDGLRDREMYAQVGSKHCMSSSSAHYQQRSNMQAQAYGNEKKSAMKSVFQSTRKK